MGRNGFGGGSSRQGPTKEQVVYLNPKLARAEGAKPRLSSVDDVRLITGAPPLCQSPNLRGDLLPRVPSPEGFRPSAGAPKQPRRPLPHHWARSRDCVGRTPSHRGWSCERKSQVRNPCANPLNPPTHPPHAPICIHVAFTLVVLGCPGFNVGPAKSSANAFGMPRVQLAPPIARGLPVRSPRRAGE